MPRIRAGKNRIMWCELAKPDIQLKRGAQADDHHRSRNPDHDAGAPRLEELLLKNHTCWCSKIGAADIAQLPGPSNFAHWAKWRKPEISKEKLSGDWAG